MPPCPFLVVRLSRFRGRNCHDVTRSERIEVIRPLLQPGARFGVVGVAVVDRGDRAIDVVQDAVLDDARAAELREAGGYGAAKVVDSPRHFDRVFGAALRVGVASGVLRKSQRLLRDVLAGNA